MAHRYKAILIFWALIAGGLVRPAPLAAAGVVGNGTPQSCTAAAFAAALAGGGNVSFNCGGGSATITISSQLTIGQNTAIDGGGRITLRGAGAERLFFANEGVRFELRNLVVTNGVSAAGGGAIEGFGADLILRNVFFLSNRAVGSGGAIACALGTRGGSLTIADAAFEDNRAARGGAIFNDGCALTISNSRISGSQGGGLSITEGSLATLSGVTLRHNTAGHGGGIENSGDLTITDSLLSGNTVTGSGGGLWNIGGRVVMRRTTVSGNRAFEGGGINSYGTHVEMDYVNVINNNADGAHGGGIFHGAGTIFISNASISDNQTLAADTHGGGIYHAADGNLTLSNATLTANHAAGFGGGLYHGSRYAILTNVTFAHNIAPAGSAIYEDAAPTPQNPGLVQLKNSLIFGNGNDCGGGLFDSLGNNIAVSGTCAALSQPSDRLVASMAALRMDDRRFNGGSFAMRTHAPLAGSPAIDAGDPASCPATDQRGAPRAGACDIGALEAGAVLPQVMLPFLWR